MGTLVDIHHCRKTYISVFSSSLTSFVCPHTFLFITDLLDCSIRLHKTRSSLLVETPLMAFQDETCVSSCTVGC